MPLRRARRKETPTDRGKGDCCARATSKCHPSGPLAHAVNVLALTVFVGFVLVSMFVLLWFAAACDPRSFSDREALLPLDDETPSVPQTPEKSRPFVL
jgi:hypothetical protein